MKCCWAMDPLSLYLSCMGPAEAPGKAAQALWLYVHSQHPHCAGKPLGFIKTWDLTCPQHSGTSDLWRETIIALEILQSTGLQHMQSPQSLMDQYWSAPLYLDNVTTCVTVYKICSLELSRQIKPNTGLPKFVILSLSGVDPSMWWQPWHFPVHASPLNSLRPKELDHKKDQILLRLVCNLVYLEKCDKKTISIFCTLPRTKWVLRRDFWVLGLSTFGWRDPTSHLALTFSV